MSRASSRAFNRLIFVLIILALLVLSIIIKQQYQKPRPLPEGKAGSVRVIDGDTFVDADGRKIRLLALDTPEKGEPYYAEAKAELARFLAGRRLKFELGPEPTDRYGRSLAFVFADDSIFVNERLLVEGLARTYFFEENMASSPYADRLCLAQKTALRKHQGVWSLPQPRPESRYFGNSETLRFHRPGCNSVALSDTSSLVRNSDRDYFLELCFSPCRNCKP